MDWTQMVVIVAAIIAVCSLTIHYIPAKPKLDLAETYDLKAKITVLEGAVKQKDAEVKMWIERGDRAFNRDDASRAELMGIYKSVVELIKNPAEVEALKTIIENIKRKDTK